MKKTGKRYQRIDIVELAHELVSKNNLCKLTIRFKLNGNETEPLRRTNLTRKVNAV